jgi:hypothetical protein
VALVLSLLKGQDFYVGDERFVVAGIQSPTVFTLLHEGSGKIFKIVDAEQTEVLDGVRISAGIKPEAMIARVAIEAPRTMLILRGEKRRNPPAGLAVVG